MTEGLFSFNKRKLMNTIGEPALQMLSGSVAEPVAGYAGMVAGAATGSPEMASRAVQGVQEAGTYQPRTPEGRSSSEKIAGLVKQVLEKVGAQEAQHYWRNTVVPAVQRNYGPVVGSSVAAAGLAMLTVVGDKFGPLPKNIPKGMRGAIGSGGRRFPDFDKWFSGSKIVDDAGSPMPVFHGTTKNINQFDITHDVGYHFGTPEQTNAFTMKYGRPSDGANVIPAYLRMRNPLELDFDFTKWPDDHAVLTRNFSFTERAMEIADTIGPERAAKELARLHAAAEKLDAIAYKYARNIDRYDWRDLRDENATKNYWKALSKYIQAAEYDGVIYPNQVEGEGLSYAVFKPEQIKSAIGNEGTFSLKSADITK